MFLRLDRTPPTMHSRKKAKKETSKRYQINGISYMPHFLTFPATELFVDVELLDEELEELVDVELDDVEELVDDDVVDVLVLVLVVADLSLVLPTFAARV